jgi:putative membrane protein
MKRFLLRLVINAVALYIAVFLLNGKGIQPQTGDWLNFIWLGLIFGAVNAFIGPVVKGLGCPVVILTLGLGTILINAVLFWLTGLIGTQFQIGFTTTFWGAILGALIVSIVSVILSTLLGVNRRP